MTLSAYTVIGLRCDAEPTTLYVAAVLPGVRDEEILIPSTTEDYLTRWTLAFEAANADDAARQAYAECARQAAEEEDPDQI